MLNNVQHGLDSWKLKFGHGAETVLRPSKRTPTAFTYIRADKVVKQLEVEHGKVCDKGMSGVALPFANGMLLTKRITIENGCVWFNVKDGIATYMVQYFY